MMNRIGGLKQGRAKMTVEMSEKAVLNYLNGQLGTGDNICDH